ncbi:MAG TPA: E2/UBC family protein [Mycobacteriales bacterium]|nr:E2/UBC family protein [Mycobacteriales bacterium]
MTDDDLVEFLRGLGLSIGSAQDPTGTPYIVVETFTIPSGSLAGRVCDIAIARSRSVPYIMPPAIHTKPALVPMNSSAPLATQGSPLGSGWQYWSRRFDRTPTPKSIWTHVLTIFDQVLP